MENNTGGIFKKIEESKNTPVSNYDAVDGLMELFNNLPKRKIKISTGHKGVGLLSKILTDEWEKELKKSMVEKMEVSVLTGKLDNKKYKKIKALLYSPDEENVNLAKRLIFNL